MKKLIFSGIGLIVLQVIIGSILFVVVTEKLKNYTEAVESKLNQKVVFDKDTLTIIDYSILEQTYILSNGKSFNFKVVDKLIIK